MPPDTAVERGEPSPYAALEARVGSLEDDMREVRATLGQMLPMIVRIDATLPHLATKAELQSVLTNLAEKPSKGYLWGVLAVLVTAVVATYGATLAAIPILLPLIR